MQRLLPEVRLPLPPRASPPASGLPGRPLAVFGAGYVGLVTATCLAWLGHRVDVIEPEPRRLRQLRQGRVPFHEPMLAELLHEQLRAGRLRIASGPRATLAALAGDGLAPPALLFVAVGTPMQADGSAALTQVMAAADDIARHLAGPAQVVIKSTVPVGTGERVQARLREGLRRRQRDWPVSVASNPEFLREGLAVQDFLRPARVVAGSEDAALLDVLRALHAPLTCAQRPFLAMDLRSAELCKYASNVMLAARLSLMNELALLAEPLGADIEQVRAAVGLDPRIGAQFLRVGCGFGGSCLPKDLQALRHAAAALGEATPMLDAIARSNERMVGLLERRLCEALGEDLRGRCVAVWGLAFKPHTDDVRDAPALALVRALCRRGAQVQAYDPLAGISAREALGDAPGFRLAPTALRALHQADALLLVTEWPQFTEVHAGQLRARMRGALVLDGRNALAGPLLAAAGLDYRGIGRGAGRAQAAGRMAQDGNPCPDAARPDPASPRRPADASLLPAG